jgi:hypothetical protein
MNLITEKTKQILLANDDREKLLEEQKVLVKFFHPMSAFTWYVISMESDEDTLYCIVKGGFGDIEIGYSSLAEISSLRVGGLSVERDSSFTKMNAKEVLDKLKAGKHV